MATFKNKLVAIVNKDIEAGVAMNALAHMTLGLGAHIYSKHFKNSGKRPRGESDFIVAIKACNHCL